jgi:LmbE family N-acetylglucosaminyl deacetylase
MRPHLLIIFFLPLFCFAQPTRQPNAAQIHLKLKKLNFLGSVLYMAAHPDDENTNIIAYLSNEKLAATAYLSLTRGDGGQNLIGPEIREVLGVIRTQELLAARSIDGGQQFFTRAIDFGFSKSADEAFSVWGKQEVLSDAVKIFRQFQPDVVITRFPPDERAGHGHHTASAIIAAEAFDLAARSSAYPEQVREFGTWQVKRLYTNTGRWWNQTITETTPGIITLDVGGYNPLLGKSYSEISALSSSQHKSQGWGRRGERGYRPEFLEYVKGPRAEKEIFEHIDTTWNRIGGGRVQPLVSQALDSFDAENPAASVPLLFKIRNEILSLDNSVWKARKLKETEELIADCLGLYIEASASAFQSTPGQRIKSSIELLNRSSANVQLEMIRGSGVKWDSVFSAQLQTNRPAVIQVAGEVSADAGFSEPYWLKLPPAKGLYTVHDNEKIGMPENPPAINFIFHLRIDGEALIVKRPLIYKSVDPVKGELWRPFVITPPVLVNLSETVLVFASHEPRQVTVVVKSASDKKLSGSLKLQVPQGWRAEPAVLDFQLAGNGSEQSGSITVYPSSAEYFGTVKAVALVNGQQYDESMQVISYDHFPVQTLLPDAHAKAVRIDLKKEGQLIGYIRGAGDEVPSALRNMGYEVWEMNNDEITVANLKRVDAVVFGIRALNTNDRSPYFMPAVLDYVKEGGTAVLQYNTNSRMETEDFSPYPLTIGRDRVTDESSDVSILTPEHPVVNWPNKITQADFKGWVQERGLYFPGKWDQRFEEILSMNDKGESPLNSSLLVAKYGKGYYIYTCLSFFRELPEGVPGAYKLFANLVSLGQKERAASVKQKSGSK